MTNRYRAFLSYSHKDERAARRIHKRLETFRLPKGLEPGVEIPGLDARRLAPVFRDREELVAAGDLSESILTAIGESAAMILVASPTSARSTYVQQEVEGFLALDPPRPLFVYVVEGNPGAPADDPTCCLPPAIREKTGAEPIAADAQTGKDGPDLAFLKIAAPLFGVRLTALRDREARRRLRRRTVASAVLLAVSLAMGGLAIFAFGKQREAIANAKLAEKNEGIAIENARLEGIQRERAEINEAEAKKQSELAKDRAVQIQRSLATFQVERGRQLVLQDQPLHALPFLLAGREHAPRPALTDLLLSRTVQMLRHFQFEIGPLPAAVRAVRITRDGSRVLVDDTEGATHVYARGGDLLGSFNGNYRWSHASVPCVNEAGTVGVGQMRVKQFVHVGFVLEVGEGGKQWALREADGRPANVDWLAVDPRGSRVIARVKSSLKIWKADDERSGRVVPGVRADTPQATAFSSDGDRAAFLFEKMQSGPNHSRVHLIDLVNAKEVQRIDIAVPHGKVALAIDNKSGRLLAASVDGAGALRLASFDLATGNALQTLDLGVDPRATPHINVCLDASRVAVWTDSLLAVAESTDTGLRTVTTSFESDNTNQVMDVQWGRGGESLVVQGLSRVPRRIAIGEGATVPIGKGSSVRMAPLDAAGYVAVQRDRINVELVPLDGKNAGRDLFPAHATKTVYLASDPEHGLLLTAGADGFVRGWKPAKREAVGDARVRELDAVMRASYPPEVYGFSPSQLVISNDRSTIAYVGREWKSKSREDSVVLVLDALTLEERRRHVIGDRTYLRLLISSDGKRVVLATHPGQEIQLGQVPSVNVHVLDEDGQRTHTIEPGEALANGPVCSGLSADGRFALLQRRPGELLRLDLASGKTDVVRRDDRGFAYLLSSDGTLLFTLQGDRVQMQRIGDDLVAGEMLFEEDVAGGSAPNQVLLGDTGDTAVMWVGNVARVWSEKSGKLVALDPQPAGVGPLTLVRGSDDVLIGQTDGSILVHSVTTGALRRRHERPPTMHTRDVFDLGATSLYGTGHSPRAIASLLGGHALGVVGLDRNLRFVAAESGALFSAIPMDPTPSRGMEMTIPGPLPHAVGVGPEQEYLVVLDRHRGRVGRWRLRLPDVISRARAIQARNPNHLEGGRITRRAR